MQIPDPRKAMASIYQRVPQKTDGAQTKIKKTTTTNKNIKRSSADYKEQLDIG